MRVKRYAGGRVKFSAYENLVAGAEVWQDRFRHEPRRHMRLENSVGKVGGEDEHAHGDAEHQRAGHDATGPADEPGSSKSNRETGGSDQGGRAQVGEGLRRQVEQVSHAEAVEIV